MLTPATQTTKRSPASRRKETKRSASVPRAISGNELKELLSPITPETFLNEYWGRKPLVIRGSRAKLRRLIGGNYTPEDFKRSIYTAAETKIDKFDLYALEHQSNLDETGAQKFKPIRPAEVEAAFTRGATISSVNPCDVRLARLAAAVKTQLNHPGAVSLLITFSPDGFGFVPHFDKTSAFFIQAEGTKRYRFSTAPVVAWPRGTTSFAPDGMVAAIDHAAFAWEQIESVDLANLSEVMLEPGDILYSPAGMIHATEASGSATLNLNLLFEHPDFLKLTSDVLEEFALDNPAWRYVPALCGQASRTALTNEAKAYITARLTELRELLAALTAETDEFTYQWQRLIANPGQGILDMLATAQPQPDTQPIKKQDRLRLSRRLPMTCASGTDSDGDDCFYAFWGNQEVSVGGEWVPFLQTLLEQEEFIAEVATHWASKGRRYPWPIVREYLAVLLTQGVIERCQ
jgi:ribosomal protein L16 Arg81 hydroxylase